ncbi:hypothetical protein C0J52_07137 [Blattella germanica]|nr:hypothetical protein C0J52_07137 [Blattella germanica]
MTGCITSELEQTVPRAGRSRLDLPDAMFAENRQSSRSQADMSAVKRKRNVLTIVEKLRVVEKIEAGVPTSSISKEFGIAKQTISDIKRSKDRIRQFSEKYDASRKNLKFPGDAKLEDAVYDWYLRQCGREIRGVEIQTVAESLAKQMNVQNFTAKSGMRPLLRQSVARAGQTNNGLYMPLVDVVRSRRGVFSAIDGVIFEDRNEVLGGGETIILILSLSASAGSERRWALSTSFGALIAWRGCSTR